MMRYMVQRGTCRAEAARGAGRAKGEARLSDSHDGIFAGGKEQWIKLDRPLPVYLLYFTAWAQEDGSVRFHHDVYGRSEALDTQAEEMKSPADQSS